MPGFQRHLLCHYSFPRMLSFQPPERDMSTTPRPAPEGMHPTSTMLSRNNQDGDTERPCETFHRRILKRLGDLFRFVMVIKIGGIGLAILGCKNCRFLRRSRARTFMGWLHRIRYVAYVLYCPR